MQVIADLEVHSKYARAVSPQMTVGNISYWAEKKGIGLVGTGDFTHPLWLRELEANLIEAGEGIYRLKSNVPEKLRNGAGKSQMSNVKFLLTSEVSCIYSHKGKGRRVHIMVYLPSFSSVKQFNSELTLRGANLFSDGRPIIGLSLSQVAEIALNVEPKAIIIPAHVWTPWFGFYGHHGGYDSLVEAFGEMEGNIHAIETGLSCYDAETEILTEEGWKKFHQVTKRDKFCTFNIDSEEIEYQTSRKIYQSEYRGKMYHLKTKRVDMLVTPNHNLLYAPADFHTRRQFRLNEAKSLFGKSKILLKSGVWKGKTLKYFTLPSVKIRHGSRFYSGLRTKAAKKLPIKSWLKFFGFWIAEGWTTAGRRSDYNVCVSNQDKALMSEMKQILESFGYTTFWDIKTTYTLRVRDYQLFNYLKKFGKASDKYVPKDVKELTKGLLETFFNYYILGDGHRYGRNGKGLSATTISTRLRDDLQEIALKIGISAYYKLHRKKGTFFSSPSQKSKYRQSADSWNIYFIRHNRHAIIPSQMKKHGHEERWVNYEGMVYCVSVPNRTLYIRRNGIPVWCGNSDPAMNWRIEELSNRNIVSFGDAHSLQKLGREATVFELPEVTFENVRRALVNPVNQVNQVNKEEKNLINSINRSTQLTPRIAYTIEFYPEEGKYHYTGHRKCKVVYSPNEARKMGTICPVCGKSLTVGVMSRVEQLASHDIEVESEKDEFGVRWIKSKESTLRAGGSLSRRPYVMLVPLIEIISEAQGVGIGSQQVAAVYDQLVNSFESEFKILLKTSIEDLKKVASPKIIEGIEKVRSGDIVIEPGYDGVFGKVKIWKENEDAHKVTPIDQGTLF